MNAVVHQVLPYRGPRDVLARMGTTAREAAETYTLREWAARLATEAAPRDYLGQLRELYRGILARWRYVREPGEWIHGSAPSLLAHVLGLKYSAPHQDPRDVDLADTPYEKGWGDCDDVATLVAAGVLALGMHAYFRVTQSEGGAHVAVVAHTPKGERVTIDPVGHPDHGFGWQLEGGRSYLYDLDGRCLRPDDAGGDDAMKTEFTGLDGIPVASGRCHYCAVPRHDAAGPRVLAMPARAARLMGMGVVLDGTPAVDEHGRRYQYDASRDLWLDERLQRSHLGAMPVALGGVRERRQARRRVRRAGRRRRLQRVVQRVRGATAKLLNNKWARRSVAAALTSVGVPPVATAAVMRASGEVLQRGGLPALIRMIRKNPQKAAQMAAAATKGRLSLGSVETPEHYVMEQGGRRFAVQPVMAIAGVPGLYSLGELEISPKPEPGRWYRIVRGDSLLKIAGQAYGVGAGAKRLERARWINQARANQVYFDPSSTDNLFRHGKISFYAKWSASPKLAIRGERGDAYALIWIPAVKGDEPPAQTPELPESSELPEDPQVEPEIPELPDVEIPEVQPEADELPAGDDDPPLDDEVEVPDSGETPADPIEPDPGLVYPSKWPLAVAAGVIGLILLSKGRRR